ncbi:MAG: hypothetical protein GXP40_05670 [Chloroflexi bacterium]|nr:hypothetical protein [Chloroflexota bacterium]
MDIGIIIEVAIGLVVVWFVLSLTAIQIQEWLAGFFRFRARDLEEAIGQMLSNPKLAEEFYEHPLIQGLTKKPGAKPSYIPAREFALALFDIVMTAGTEQSAIQQTLALVREKDVAKMLPGIKNFLKRIQAKKALDDLMEQVEGLVASETAGSVMEQLQPQMQALSEQYPELQNAIEKIPVLVKEYQTAVKALPQVDLTEVTPEQIQKGIAAIGKINPDLVRTLNSLFMGVEQYVTEKEQALALARTNVENWFNNSMDRLSGWYKRRSNLIAFVIGLVLAATLNVNSITIAQTLWVDPTMRAALISKAEGIQPPTQTEGAAPEDAIREFSKQFEGITLPMGWTAIEMPAETACALLPQTDTAIQGLFIAETCYRPISADDPASGNWLFVWFIGILISATAVSQGAPFWFDILMKLINVRNTGAKPPSGSEAAA